MKYFTFYRESNKFDDILDDASIKKYIKMKIKWNQHLLIGVSELHDSSAISVITLKYGDEMVNNLTKDYTPEPGIDYKPEKDKNKFVKKQI
jgi:hypothetical protein